MTIQNTVRCEFCSSVLAPLVLYGHVLAHEPCECWEATEKRRALDEAEKAEREKLEQEKKERRMRRAGIKPRYWGAETDLDLKAYYIVGKVGSGKTYLAAALARKAMALGSSVVVSTGFEMLSQVKSTFGEFTKESSDSVVSRYETCDWLIIDDLGKENPTGFARETMFRIIDSRYENLLPLIVTSNYERNELIKRLGNDIDAIALVSRLSEMCERYEVEGSDRRLHG